MGFLDRFFDRGASPPGPDEVPAPDARELVRGYHRATKHHIGRYARGPHDLNWDTQPNPFRRYAGCEVIQLDQPDESASPSLDSVVQEGGVASAELNRVTISALFRYALGLSAWKVYGESRWSLRVNPSSGNLHPTEGYLVSGPIEGLSSTGVVAHYAPELHALEVRARIDSSLWDRLVAGLPDGALVLGLSSILWREEWKYGERAYRYCQHDVGHAIAALAYSASCLGWRTRVCDQLSSAQVAQVLGLGGGQDAEPEEPDTLLAVFPATSAGETTTLDPEAIEGFSGLDWKGTPNQLSGDHLHWDAVQACAIACEKPRTELYTAWSMDSLDAPSSSSRAAWTVIAGRRSAVALDGRTTMSATSFYKLLERVLPRPGRVPFAALSWRPRVHLLCFVHRVEGLEPGAYALLREPVGGRRLRDALSSEFLWESPRGCPEGLPLYRLREADLRSMATSVSCDQAIAGAGAFSLGMLAEFDQAIEEQGAWFYPRLFWEAGAIGQALYLESEALGLRGTGIGCFLDDPVHQSLGLRDTSFQSLYHFTVGGPVEDTRIQSEPAYGKEL